LGSSEVTKVKVSNKLQISVPAEARKKLNIKAGDYLIVEVRGDSLVLSPETKDYAALMRGFHADVWENVDPDEYIRRERDSWSE
jgi:AbrB family looped-hinge helix DNA binding protein